MHIHSVFVVGCWVQLCMLMQAPSHTLAYLQQDESWPGVWVSNVESAQLYWEWSLGAKTTPNQSLASTPWTPRHYTHMHIMHIKYWIYTDKKIVYTYTQYILKYYKYYWLFYMQWLWHIHKHKCTNSLCISTIFCKIYSLKHPYVFKKALHKTLMTQRCNNMKI